jgi:hypothetical protein
MPQRIAADREDEGRQQCSSSNTDTDIIIQITRGMPWRH